MFVQNSQIAGYLLTAIFVTILIGLNIWRRIKYPGRKNQVADPLAEAEVYLAYGQKKKAIELLKKAQSAYPNRADIRKKLDELYVKP